DTTVTWLTDTEVDALVAAPDRGTWCGRRDHTMIVLAVQTGLRVSELTSLNISDVHVRVGAHVRCVGKGRLCRLPHKRPYVARWTMSRSSARERALAANGLRERHISAPRYKLSRKARS